MEMVPYHAEAQILSFYFLQFENLIQKLFILSYLPSLYSLQPFLCPWFPWSLPNARYLYYYYCYYYYIFKQINKACCVVFSVAYVHMLSELVLRSLSLGRLIPPLSAVIKYLSLLTEALGPCEISLIQAGMSTGVVIVQDMFRQPYGWGITGGAPHSYQEDTLSQ